MKRISARLGTLSAFALTLITCSGAFAADAFSRRYSDIERHLESLVAKYPTTELIDLGVNDTGQRIRALKTGAGPVKNLVVATHHGNEYGSTEVALALAESLAESPLAGQTVYVIPVLNTSGYDRRSRQEQGRDPNRDYPGPCGSSGPFKLRSTKALADFVEREGIVVSATLHTHAPAVLYPWGFSTPDLKTEYEELYIEMAKAAVQESQYAVGNSTALLYAANGCYEDYVFWKHGVWSLLFELGFSHNPNQRALDELVRVNVPGVRRYLETAPRERAEKHAFTGRCEDRKGREKDE